MPNQSRSLWRLKLEKRVAYSNASQRIRDSLVEAPVLTRDRRLMMCRDAIDTLVNYELDVLQALSDRLELKANRWRVALPIDPPGCSDPQRHWFHNSSQRKRCLKPRAVTELRQSIRASLRDRYGLAALLVAVLIVALALLLGPAQSPLVPTSIGGFLFLLAILLLAYRRTPPAS